MCERTGFAYEHCNRTRARRKTGSRIPSTCLQRINAKLEHYEKYIDLVTDYIKEMYADEAKMVERGHMFYPPRDTKEYKMTRGIASADLTADDLKDEILFFSNLEPIWAPIAKENKSLITTEKRCRATISSTHGNASLRRSATPFSTRRSTRMRKASSIGRIKRCASASGP